MKIFSNDRHTIAPNPMMAERGSKGKVIGVSCPDPMDRNKNDSSLCMLNEFANDKKNELNLMNAKGGHSWPPILCNGFSDMLCGHFCPSHKYTTLLVHQ